MIIDDYTNLPDYPFDTYFKSVNAYISAQQYWLQLLPLVINFEQEAWAPVTKPVDMADDMYTGLLVDIENVQARKSLKIRAISHEGWANFVLKEGLETARLMSRPSPVQKELFASHSTLVAQGILPGPITTQDAAMVDANQKFAQTGGFEACVQQRDFYDEAFEDTPQGPFMYGEELTILSTISPESEPKALEAIALFLRPGTAIERVNERFCPE